jgi:hypothetical protein
MCVSFGVADSKSEARLCAVESLDLTLLVD